MKRKAAERDGVLEAKWIFLAVIIPVLVIAIRVRLLGIPLERDEGEYAYAGQLMLQGIPPYKLAYNMKFPGTYAKPTLCTVSTILRDVEPADARRKEVLL